MGFELSDKAHKVFGLATMFLKERAVLEYDGDDAAKIGRPVGANPADVSNLQNDVRHAIGAASSSKRSEDYALASWLDDTFLLNFPVEPWGLQEKKLFNTNDRATQFWASMAGLKASQNRGEEQETDFSAFDVATLLGFRGTITEAERNRLATGEVPAQPAVDEAAAPEPDKEVGRPSRVFFMFSVVALVLAGPFAALFALARAFGS